MATWLFLGDSLASECLPFKSRDFHLNLIYYVEAGYRVNKHLTSPQQK
jgi:hypothetical protein